MKGLPPVSFVLFIIIVVLAGALVNFQLSCPIDHGTGTLTAAQGLSIENVESKLVGVDDVLAAGEYASGLIRMSSYKYAVVISISNKSKEPSRGTLSVVFSRRSGSQQIIGGGGRSFPVVFPVYVDVPAGTTKSVQYVMSFIDQLYTPGSQDDPHWAVVEAGKDMPDPVCSGTGKLPFVKWLQTMERKADRLPLIN